MFKLSLRSLSNVFEVPAHAPKRGSSTARSVSWLLLVIGAAVAVQAAEPPPLLWSQLRSEPGALVTTRAVISRDNLTYIVVTVYDSSDKRLAVRLLCLTPSGEERYIAELDTDLGNPIDVDVDQSGNAYVTATLSNPGGADGRATMSKVNASGQTLWGVVLPLVPGLGNLVPIESGVNPLGVPLIAGYAWQEQLGLKSFVYRINTSDGTVVWSSTNSAANSSSEMQFANHNDPVLAVKTHSSAIHLTRRDWRTGAVVWSKTFSRGVQNYIGDVAVDTSNNTIVTATSQATSSFDSNDWWVFKVDPNGSTVWSRLAGGPLQDYAGEIELGADSSVFVEGRTTPSGQAASTRAAARFSPLGTQQYFHVFPRIPQLLRTSIDVDGAGNLYLAAADYQNLHLHALSPSGNLLWEGSLDPNPSLTMFVKGLEVVRDPATNRDRMITALDESQFSSVYAFGPVP